MSTTYRVDGLHYTDLADLLSTGWPEDKTVELWDGKILQETTTLAKLRRTLQPEPIAQLRRVVAVANEGFAEHAPNGGYQYAVAMIVEDEPGWAPGNWYRTLDQAKVAAAAYNRAAGHSLDTVQEVQVSSMRAGRVR